MWTVTVRSLTVAARFRLLFRAGCLCYTQTPMIDFTLSPEQHAMREMTHWFAEQRIRPLALEADRTGRYPDKFLRELAAMSAGRGMMGQSDAGGTSKEGRGSEAKQTN